MTATVAAGRRSYGGFGTRVLEVEGAGVRLVFLHGFADSALTWTGVLEELRGGGHAAVAVDLPGFGDAAALRAGPVLPQLDEFVTALVAEQAALGPVVLVGNSLGGCAAIRAVERGLPVAAVVAMGDPALARTWLATRFRSEKDSWAVRLATRPWPVPPRLFDRGARIILRRLLYADPGRADPAVVARFVEYFQAKGRAQWVTRTVRSLARELDDCYDFTKITCPALVVHGAKDRIVPVRTSKHLHRNVVGSKLVIRPDWGHCPQLDDPASLVRLLLAFSEDPVRRAQPKGPRQP